MDRKLFIKELVELIAASDAEEELQEYLDGEVRDRKDMEASNINNGGYSGQLDFLLPEGEVSDSTAKMWRTDLMDVIEEVKP